MGVWEIRVRGHGPHHNEQARDADHLARELVDRLKEAGHTEIAGKFMLLNSMEDIVGGARPEISESQHT
jgi:hypothetical protein